MTEQNEEQLTRRHFLKWGTFGILAVTVTAGTGSFMKRLIEAERWSANDLDITDVTSLTMDQFLQSCPKLSGEFSLAGPAGSRTLKSAYAVFMINESAYAVLSHCDGGRTVNNLCDMLVSDFGVLLERAQTDLVGFLNGLYQLQIMSFSVTFKREEQYEAEASQNTIWSKVAS